MAVIKSRVSNVFTASLFLEGKKVRLQETSQHVFENVDDFDVEGDLGVLLMARGIIGQAWSLILECEDGTSVLKHGDTFGASGKDSFADAAPFPCRG